MMAALLARQARGVPFQFLDSVAGVGRQHPKISIDQQDYADVHQLVEVGVSLQRQHTREDSLRRFFKQME